MHIHKWAYRWCPWRLSEPLVPVCKLSLSHQNLAKKWREFSSHNFISLWEQYNILIDSMRAILRCSDRSMISIQYLEQRKRTKQRSIHENHIRGTFSRWGKKEGKKGKKRRSGRKRKKERQQWTRKSIEGILPLSPPLLNKDPINPVLTGMAIEIRSGKMSMNLLLRLLLRLLRLLLLHSSLFGCIHTCVACKWSLVKW